MAVRAKPKSEYKKPMTAKEIRQIQSNAISEAVDKTTLLFFLAFKDLYPNVTKEDLILLHDKCTTITSALDSRIIDLRDIQVTLEEETGIEMKGFLNNQYKKGK